MAAKALTNVAFHCTNEFLQEYLHQLLEKLFNLLGASSNDSLTEQLLSSIAALAMQSKHLFDAYYDSFAPKLMNVISGTKNESLRGQALECISYIGEAVGAAKFENDAAKLMPFTLQYYKNSDVTGDERMFGIVMQTWPRICAAIGTKFTPYLNEVMPIVLQAAKLDCEIEDLDNYKKNKAAKLAHKQRNNSNNHQFHNKMNHFDQSAAEVAINEEIENNIEERWGHQEVMFFSFSFVCFVVFLFRVLCLPLFGILFETNKQICNVYNT